MIGPIERYMTEDHIRIDALLRRSLRGDEVDADAFEEFREALLRHIGMEEKILVPMLRDRGAPFEHAARLRREHGEIARLLVPTPTRALCDRICEMLAVHDPLEEGEGGLYCACDVAAGRDAERIIERLRAVPRVPLAKHVDGGSHISRLS
jgi:hypothetical protein